MLFPEVTFRPVAGDDATVQFSAVWWRGNDNPALRRFLSVARSLAKKRKQHASSTSADRVLDAPSLRGISLSFASLGVLARRLGLST